jgi:hypothetical protein
LYQYRANSSGELARDLYPRPYRDGQTAGLAIDDLSFARVEASADLDPEGADRLDDVLGAADRTSWAVEQRLRVGSRCGR